MEKRKTVLIMGRNSLLNYRVQFFIQHELSVSETRVCSDPGDWDHKIPVDDFVLLLVDNDDADAKSVLFQSLLSANFKENGGFKAALFNVDPDDDGVIDALRRGVRGLFFASDPIPKLLAGVGQMLNDDAWIPKKVLIEAALQPARIDEGIVVNSHVTMREMQILAMVCTGATNDQIADRLCISPHTVKTHMYNIFPKIGARNRLDAALWATKNLGSQVDRLVQMSTQTV